MSSKGPTARKIPKGQVSWGSVREKRDFEYKPFPEEEEESQIIPDWMKQYKAILILISLFLILTIVAYFVTYLSFVLVLVGIGIMIGSYFIGGGVSEWHPAAVRTTMQARSAIEYRYHAIASNWDVIIGGFVLGGIFFLAGVVSILFSTFL